MDIQVFWIRFWLRKINAGVSTLDHGRGGESVGKQDDITHISHNIISSIWDIILFFYFFYNIAIVCVAKTMVGKPLQAGKSESWGWEAHSVLLGVKFHHLQPSHLFFWSLFLFWDELVMLQTSPNLSHTTHTNQRMVSHIKGWFHTDTQVLTRPRGFLAHFVLPEPQIWLFLAWHVGFSVHGMLIFSDTCQKRSPEKLHLISGDKQMVNLRFLVPVSMCEVHLRLRGLLLTEIEC